MRICHCQHGCRTSESEELVDWDWALGDGSWEAAARAFGQVININAKCHVLHFTKHSFPFSFFLFVRLANCVDSDGRFPGQFS